MTIYKLTTEYHSEFDSRHITIRLFTNVDDALASAKDERDEWLGDLSYGVDKCIILVQSLSPQGTEFITDELLYHFLWTADWASTDRAKLAEIAVITESYK